MARKREHVEVDGLHEVASFELGKARRFLRLLTDHPFLAIVVEDGVVRFFARGDFGRDEIEQVLAALQQIIEEN